MYDVERLINILKSIKDDISEVKQRLKRLEDKVDEDERRQMMGER